MLILKENAANSVPVPPAGKDTFFIDDSGTPSVKNASGNVTTFPTTAASNSQVLFMNGTALTGDADITWNYNTNVLTVVGNIGATRVLTDNLLYANGTAWDLSDPGGSNTQIQFNDDESFGGSAAFTFNKSSNLVSMGGALSVTGNANVGNIGAAAGVFTTVAGTLTTVAQPNVTSVGTLTSLSVTGNISAGNVSATTFTGALSGAATTAGTVTTAAQPNITSVGTLTSLAVTGNISAGNVSATTFTGALSGAATTAGTVTTAAQPNITSTGTLTSLAVTGNISAGNVSATTFTGALSGAATTAGTVTTAAQPNITSVGTLTGLGVNGTITGVNITANTGVFTGNGSGLSAIAGANVTGTVANATHASTANTVVDAAQPNITSVGTLTSLGVNGTVTAVAFTANTGVFTGNGSGLSQLTGANVTGTVSSATTAGTVTTAAQPNITSVGTLTSLAVTGNATAGNVYANSGTIGALLLTGTLTTAAQPNVTSVGTLTSLAVTGNISAGNVSATTFTGALSGDATTAGTVTTAAQPNITSVGTLTSATVTGNVAAGNLTTTGVLSVTGTGVSSIAGNLDMTSNTIINLASPTNPNDAATKQYVDDVAQGLHTHDSCNAATQTTLATISGGTVTYSNGTDGVGATLTTTGSYTTIDGVTLSNGMRILVKNEANTAHNGIYDRTSTTVLTRSSDFDTPVEMAGGDFTFVTAGTLYDNTGWVMPDPVTTVGTTPVVWVQFSGAGTYTAGTGLTLNGSQFSVNASQTQITAVGTLGSLAVTGNITAGNVSATTFTGALSGAATTAGTVTTAAQPNITSVGTLTSLAVTGNISAGNVSATTFTGSLSGAATSASTAGTVTTAAQPNITSVGTLTSLAVTGNISAGNVSATTFTGALSGAATTAGTVTTAAQPNITSVGTLTGLGVNGTVTAVNITANTGVFTGNGSALTALNGSNISSGTIAQARLANSSLTVNGTSISLGGSGTITANTTQTLTLGSFLTGTSFNGGTAVTAAVDATSTNTASKVVARDASGNFAAGTITATLSGAATTAGTVTTAAQPNITSVGTLTSLSVSGGITNANLTTGANTTAGSLTGNWTLTAGSRLQATYADLAEKYVADADYEEGTVLVFGGEHEVTVAHEFDSHRVAGVVSHNAAYIMNAACEGEHVIDLALTGRVPVKVHGPVAKGDLMVTGSNGHAVANNQARAGTILGKALQNFAGGSGIIEVVVGRV